jgi:hypothetical protein
MANKQINENLFEIFTCEIAQYLGKSDIINGKDVAVKMSGGGTYLIYGPYITLPAGTYSVAFTFHNFEQIQHNLLGFVEAVSQP